MYFLGVLSFHFLFVSNLSKYAIKELVNEYNELNGSTTSEPPHMQNIWSTRRRSGCIFRFPCLFFSVISSKCLLKLNTHNHTQVEIIIIS